LISLKLTDYFDTLLSRPWVCSFYEYWFAAHFTVQLHST